jgi:hypothetical protein
MDVDGEAGLSSLERHHPEMAQVNTFIQKTPHGHHLFFNTQVRGKRKVFSNFR